MTGIKCPTNGDCGYLNYCDVLNQCQHDPLWPITAYTGMVYAISPILIGMGMVGGLGGGVLKGPIFMTMLNYDVKKATLLSYCLMFGGCITNTFQIMRKEHPYDEKRPLINYDIVLIFNCSIFIGSQIGSATNIFLPQLFGIIFLELFLIFIIRFLISKIKNLRKSNKIRKDSQESLVNYRRTQDLSLAMLSVYDNNQTVVQQKSISEDSEAKTKRARQLQSSIQQINSFFPIRKILIIFFFFCVTQMIMVGGKQLGINFHNCFKVDYLLMIVLIIAFIPLTYWLFKRGQQEEQLRDEIKLFEKERYYNSRSFMMVYCSGLLAGFVSGSLGLGAGLVMVPILLQLKVHPRVASATSGFTYFWIASNNFLKLLVEGLLDYQLILSFTVIGLIGGSVFARIGYYFQDKYKLNSLSLIVVVILAFMNVIAGAWQLYYTQRLFGWDTVLNLSFNC